MARSFFWGLVCLALLSSGCVTAAERRLAEEKNALQQELLRISNQLENARMQLSVCQREAENERNAKMDCREERDALTERLAQAQYHFGKERKRLDSCIQQTEKKLSECTGILNRAEMQPHYVCIQRLDDCTSENERLRQQMESDLDYARAECASQAEEMRKQWERRLAEAQQQIERIRAEFVANRSRDDSQWRGRLSETEKRSFYQGRLSLWEALSIEGKPYSEGLLFKDHFFTYIIRVNNRELYRHTVATDGVENAFSRTLSSVQDIAWVMTILR